jgi:hypothetical protein
VAGSAVVQDSTGGILIRLGDDAGSLALGQLVELDGTRSTKAGMVSLRVTKPALALGTLADPDPLRRATGALGEAEEARLVVARGAVSTAVTKLGGGGISFAIDDGSGPIRITVSWRTGIAAGSVARGAWLELRGVLGQETTGKEPLRGYRVWPRIAADLRVVAAPVAGSGATAGCCLSADRSTRELAVGGYLEGSQDGDGAVALMSPGLPPSLTRPYPTTSPAAATTGTDAVERGALGPSPRGAGLVVSGMGLAAVAALLAWFGRRPRPGSDDVAGELPVELPVELPFALPVALPGTELPGAIPHLALLRADTEGPSEERRILPPT